MAAKEAKRTRHTDAEADKFATKIEKERELHGKAAAEYWRRHGARRLMALAEYTAKKVAKPHKAKPKAHKPKAKGKAKKTA